MTKEEIKKFLERLGTALSSGDVPTIASCWKTPALVLHGERALAVADEDEVARFFAQAVQAYHGIGLASTRPEVQHIDRLSDTLAAVIVRWPAFDPTGVEKASERSYYILQTGEDGDPQIRVAVTMAT